MLGFSGAGRPGAGKKARAALLALSLLVAGTALSTTMALAEPVSGGEMTIINGSDIKSWDPAVTNATYPGGPMDMLDAVYGFLVYLDVDGNIQGGMAESLTSQDAKV